MIADKYQSTLVGLSFGLLAALIWGSWPVVSKHLTSQSLTMWDLTAIRFTAAGCVLIPVLFYQLSKVKGWLVKGSLLSIGAGAPYVLVATLGLTLAPSSHFGLIAPSCMLLFTTIGSVLLFKEKISASRWLGIVMILLGVASVSFNQIGTVSLSTLSGDMLFVCSGFLWASYTLLCKHWQLKPWLATSMVAVFSMVAYLPFYLANHLDSLRKIPLEVLLQQGFYQGVVTSILALYCYSKCVSILGAAQGAVFAALVPPTTILLSITFLGESLAAAEQIGLFAVSTGFVFALGIASRVHRAIFTVKVRNENSKKY